MKITENELRELLLAKLKCDNIPLIRPKHDPAFELPLNHGMVSKLNGRYAVEETLQDFIQYALEDGTYATGCYDVRHSSYNVYFDPHDSEPVAFFHRRNSLDAEPLFIIHLASGQDGIKCYGGSYEEMDSDIESGKLIILPK